MYYVNISRNGIVNICPDLERNRTVKRLYSDAISTTHTVPTIYFGQDDTQF